jgi:hypothetical protein
MLACEIMAFSIIFHIVTPRSGAVAALDKSDTPRAQWPATPVEREGANDCTRPAG